MKHIKENNINSAKYKKWLNSRKPQSVLLMKKIEENMTITYTQEIFNVYNCVTLEGITLKYDDGDEIDIEYNYWYQELFKMAEQDDNLMGIFNKINENRINSMITSSFDEDVEFDVVILQDLEKEDCSLYGEVKYNNWLEDLKKYFNIKENIKLFREYVETTTEIETDQDIYSDQEGASELLGNTIPQTLPDSQDVEPVEDPNIKKEEIGGKIVYTIKDWKIY